ncbi:hypothetical protein, partial [Stenotrophomonas maltophilia]|uniref:hypothetical protein n=1 Tax=Stenotrophomonas maltophilia TaxID=40324 RepID=UPI0019D3D39D
MIHLMMGVKAMKSTAGFAAIRAQPLGGRMQKRHPARVGMAFGPAACATESQRAASADAISCWMARAAACGSVARRIG